MAKDTLATKGIPLNPAGIDDNSPLNADASFYQTRGVVSLGEQCLERITGKLLIEKYETPVLGIHGSIGNQYYVETVDQLILYNSLGLGVAPEPFPTTDLILWLEADSLSLSDGDPIPLWNDQTIQNNDVTQINVGQQPTYKTGILNGLPIVRFDGTNDTLIKDGSADFFIPGKTIFAVRTNNNGYLLSITEPSSIDNEMLIHTTSIFHQWAPGSVSIRSHQNSVQPSFFLQSTIFGVNPTDLQVWINGVISTDSLSVIGTPNAYTNVGRSLYLGSRFEFVTQYGNFDIAALMIFSAILTDPQRIAVETYLTNKWGPF